MEHIVCGYITLSLSLLKREKKHFWGGETRWDYLYYYLRPEELTLYTRERETN